MMDELLVIKDIVPSENAKMTKAVPLGTGLCVLCAEVN